MANAAPFWVVRPLEASAPEVGRPLAMMTSPDVAGADVPAPGGRLGVVAAPAVWPYSGLTGCTGYRHPVGDGAGSQHFLDRTRRTVGRWGVKPAPAARRSAGCCRLGSGPSALTSGHR